MLDQIRKLLADPTIARALEVAIAITVVVLVVRFLQGFSSRHIRDVEARYRVRKVIAFIGYVAAIVVVATILGLRLGGLGVALGVAGAGVAFALQEVIASVAGWVALSFSRFYAPGDRVQLGGIKGDVIDIGILRTTLMEVGQWVKGDLYNGRIVRVANSFVFKEPVFNYSGDFPFVWDELTVPIKYGGDWKRAKAIMTSVVQEVVGEYVPVAREAWAEMLERYRLEEASVEPMVTLVANDNWIEFTIRYVVDYRRRRTTRDRLFTRLMEEIEATQDAIGIASMTVHLVEAPPVRVSLVGPNGPKG